MTSDDHEQESPPLDAISQEEREEIAFKIWMNEKLSVEEWRKIYFALTSEWEPVSFFGKKKGRKSYPYKSIGLAEDVEKLQLKGEKISAHMGALGEEYEMAKGKLVDLDTFNKSLARSRKKLKLWRLFKSNLNRHK